MVEGAPLRGVDRMPWVGDYARVGAERCPDRPAIVQPESSVSITYAELDRRVGRAIALLKGRGLERGDRLAYLGKNSELFYILMLAAIRGGFVIAPLNWRCATPEIAFFLEDSGAKLLFCDPEFEVTAKAASQKSSCPPALIPTRGREGDPFIRQLTEPGVVETASIAHGDAVCLLLYTSGTSGRPKGVLCTHRGLSLGRQSEFVLEDFPVWSGGAIVSAMPHFHIGGISWMLIGLMRQSTCVLTADPSGPNIARLLREYRASKTFAVPTVVRSIVDDVRNSDNPIRTLDTIFYGAAPIGESLLGEARATLGCDFGQYYGMTEITGSATFLAPRFHDTKRPELMKSVGRALPGVSIDIRDPEGRSLPPNQSGEIWIKSPTLMAGYWNRPDDAAAVVHDGWYRSGDGGMLDDEGFLYLTDRIKDMIVSGGENIYPAEIEEVLRTHPAVLDAAAVARPDERWGESVLAAVECRPGQSVSAEELIAHARTRLAAFKCPKTIVFVDALPRTASGKVQRGEARKITLARLS